MSREDRRVLEPLLLDVSVSAREQAIAVAEQAAQSWFRSVIEEERRDGFRTYLQYEIIAAEGSEYVSADSGVVAVTKFDVRVKVRLKWL